MKRTFAPVAIVAAGVAIAAWILVGASRRAELPVYWDAPEFALVDQLGDTVRTADLEGRVWVTSFIFTNCTGVCPLITSKMARVRDSLAAAGLLGTEVRLISITVDPARDTPPVLGRYAERFGGSPPAHWALLTGTPPEAVRRVIQDGFRVTAVLDAAAAPDPTTNYQVQHTPRIMLVDREGVIRGTYNAIEPDALERVFADLGALVEWP